MKKIKFLPVIVVCLFLSSCLEILEDVKVNADGTGTFKLIVNLSQSKAQIDKILSQDTIQGYAIPSKEVISQNIEYLAKELEMQNGISGVSKETDLINYIIKLSFSFDKIESLNIAVNNIIKKQDPKAPLNPLVYSFEGKKFNRSFNSELMSQAYRDKEKVGAFLSDFDNAKLTSVFKFDSEIISTDHSNAKLSSSKKNIFEQTPLNNLLSNENLYKHNIVLQ